MNTQRSISDIARIALIALVVFSMVCGFLVGLS